MTGFTRLENRAAPEPSCRAGGAERLPTVDALRGLAICWITTYHFFVDARGATASAWATPGALTGALTSGDVLAALRVLATALLARSTFRTDVFLFLTGMVLAMTRSDPAGSFLWRRLRAVLPNYWLGSLLVTAALVAFAAVRAFATSAPLSLELEHGSLLAGQPYRFAPLDLLRSLSVVGRLQNAGSMQVVAPSLWYVVLVLQAYFAFPPLRAALARLGRMRFLGLCLLGTWAARALLFWLVPAHVDPNAACVNWLPFRLAPLALGIAAASGARPLLRRPLRGRALGLAVPALALLAGATWLGAASNVPGTLFGTLGPVVPMTLALPALWSLAATSLALPPLARILTWAGRHSLSILVVQDVLRLAVGTGIATGFAVSAHVWALAPLYLAAALGAARVWDPLPKALAERFWPRERPARSVLRRVDARRRGRAGLAVPSAGGDSLAAG